MEPPTPPVCPVCLREQKRVPLVAISERHLMHMNDFPRGRNCHITVFDKAVLEAQPKAEEAKP